MQYSDRELTYPGFFQEIIRETHFIDAIFFEWATSVFLFCRHLNAMPVNPDGTADKHTLHLSSEGIHQVLSALRGKTDHINHNIRPKRF